MRFATIIITGIQRLRETANEDTTIQDFIEQIHKIKYCVIMHKFDQFEA